jgi:hypothetical protein
LRDVLAGWSVHVWLWVFGLWALAFGLGVRVGAKVFACIWFLPQFFQRPKS